jgi:hypothetical protein
LSLSEIFTAQIAGRALLLFRLRLPRDRIHLKAIDGIALTGQGYKRQGTPRARVNDDAFVRSVFGDGVVAEGSRPMSVTGRLKLIEALLERFDGAPVGESQLL